MTFSAYRPTLALGHVLAAAVLLIAAPLSAQEELQDCEECPVMVTVPAGSFVRSLGAEAPGFEVSLDVPYAISMHEITVGQFRRFIDATGHAMEGGCTLFTLTGGGRHEPELNWMSPGYRTSDARPVNCVSEQDAWAYAGWLSEMSGETYRLPSEAEWAYAARAGRPNDVQWFALGYLRSGDAFCATCFGGEVMGREDQLTPSQGGGKANPFGIVAMLGNVAEWTSDCYAESLDGAPVDGAARADGDCNMRSARGGAFHNEMTELAGFRMAYGTDVRRNDIGIRLARDL